MHIDNMHRLLTRVMIVLCLVGIVACCAQENAEAVVAWAVAFAMSLGWHGELSVSACMMEDRDYWREKFVQAQMRYALGGSDGTAKDSEK